VESQGKRSNLSSLRPWFTVHRFVRISEMVRLEAPTESAVRLSVLALPQIFPSLLKRFSQRAMTPKLRCEGCQTRQISCAAAVLRGRDS